MIVTRLVALGTPREKFWLPRIVQPPKPKAPDAIKLSEDPNAAPAPKEAPKLEDTTISKDLRAPWNAPRPSPSRPQPRKPREGSLTGSAQGTSNQAVSGGRVRHRHLRGRAQELVHAHRDGLGQRSGDPFGRGENLNLLQRRAQQSTRDQAVQATNISTILAYKQ